MRLCAVSNGPTIEGGGDLILPCQYHDLSGGHLLTGEQRLMLALLIDAINVYQRGAMTTAARARRLYIDAEHWIMTHSSHASALSFETACDALGIHPGMLRRRIVDWKHAIHRHHGHRSSSRLRLRVTPRARLTSHRRGRPALKAGSAS